MLQSFILPDWFEAPEQIKNELVQFWNKSYYEIYEEKYFDESTLVSGELEPDIIRILNLLVESDRILSRKRLIYFNWALCLAAKDNIDRYLTDTSEYQFTLNELTKWEVSGHQALIEIDNGTFSKQENFNVVAEAISTFRNMIDIIKADSINAVVSTTAYSIDCCLQGSGICHGAVDKRAIFNWLLLCVFPSAYCCKLPSFIYTVEFNIENWIYYKKT